MRTALASVVAGACIALSATAAELVPDGDAFVWTRGEGSVRMLRSGIIEPRLGEARTSLGIAFWHDAASGGFSSQSWSGKPQIESTERGFALRGAFEYRGKPLPLQFTQTVTPDRDALRVRYEFRKTGAISLRRGVLLTLDLPYAKFSGKRLWLQPGRGAKLPCVTRGLSDTIALELGVGRAVELKLDGLKLVWTASGGVNASRLFVGLTPGPAEGESTHAEMVLRFRDLPKVLPGEIPASRQPLALRGATPSSRRIPRYDKLELEVDLSAAYDNPFDPDDVALDGRFTAPSGKVSDVPGFFMVGFERRVLDAGELVVPTGKQSWRLRFTPMEVGTYRYELALRDRTGTVRGAAGEFEAVASDLKGFVRTSRADPHHFAFDNGDGYFPIGHNLPSYSINGQTAEQAMRKFAAAGENYNRWWMASYTGLGLEWEHTLGWYRQDEAARLDYILDLGRELGMYYMLCMDTHQDFRDQASWHHWHFNPFNAALGGPCEKPSDWLKNPEARSFYKKRLRYTVARWGFSPQVLCWEFGNEFEGWPGATMQEKLAWHEEMAAHLKALDPFDHLVTTSFWGKTGPVEFWKSDSMDIVQTHCYTNDDLGVAPLFAQFCATQADAYEKPHIFGEFGIRSHATTRDKDPKGWALHNGMWSCVVSRCAGAPMPWWHGNYIDPLDLYFHFTSVARFMRDLPIGKVRWRPLEADPVEYAPGQVKQVVQDATLVGPFHWGKPPVTEFTVAHEGTVNDADKLPRLLQGRGHPDLRNPPTFVVHYQRDGRFIVHVNVVSRSGRLRIWLDDELALDQELPCGEGLGKASEHKPEWKLWQTTYDQEFAIDVPKGKHRIRVDNNEGGDWVWVKRYVLTNYQSITRPPLLVLGMQADEVAVVWIHNRDSTWLQHAQGHAPEPTKPARVVIRGLRDGARTVQWWETWKGSVEHTDSVTAVNGALTLAIPSISTDVAAKIR